jgi:hypothetical protein
MATVQQARSTSKSVLWTSWIMSALPVLMVLFASSLKLMRSPAVIQGMQKYGFFDPNLAVLVGVIELTCVIVYLIPKTSVTGAILLTALFGGAIVTNVRVGDSGWVVPLILGLLAWGGLYLRDPRIRELIPIRR